MKKVLLILTSFILFSCSSDDDSSSQPPNNSNPSNNVAFFKATVGGQVYNYVQETELTGNSYYQIYTGYSNGGGYFDRSYSYGCFMIPMSAVDFYPSLEITFHNMTITDDSNVETEMFYDSFDPIPNGILTNTQLGNLEKGVEVTFRDENDNYYSTLYGPQTNASISFTNKTTSMANGFKRVTLEGSVSNCVVYNFNDPNDYKTFSNGTFKLIFQEFD